MTQTPQVIRDNMGKPVVIQNPHIASARWAGRLIGYLDEPSAVIEYPNGRQMSLPAAWVAPAAPTSQSRNPEDHWSHLIVESRTYTSNIVNRYCSDCGIEIDPYTLGDNT